jgi:hypothetical protein
MTMFHWTENLFFGRKSDGAVRLLKFERTPDRWPEVEKAADPRAGVLLDVSIPAAEWASITSSVSHAGEATNYQHAVDLHNGKGEASA